MSVSPSRRQFLEMATTGAVLGFTATSYAKVAGANERIGLGLIGCGGRGYQAHMGGIHPFDKEQNAAFVAVSDPWRVRRERAAVRAEEWYGRPAKQFSKALDVIHCPEVNAVMIASCDHQHCAHLEAAAKAKKDAYCEKPLAMTMESLVRTCDAVKAAGIVAQMGTQVRSRPTSAGCRKLFQAGAIGKVSRIEQCRNSTKPYWYGRLTDLPEVKQEDVDWEEFLMDRPKRAFDPKLLMGWYGYREFSDGPIPNLGCHFIDLYNYIVGTTLPTSCVAQGGIFTWKDEYGFTCPDQCQAVWIYPEGLMVSYTTNTGNGDGRVLKIYGDLGTFDLTDWTAPTYSAVGARLKSTLPKKPTPVEPVEIPDHFLNWLQCLRSRAATNAPIEAGYHHAVPAIMAIRAMDTGKRQVYDAAMRTIREG